MMKRLAAVIISGIFFTLIVTVSAYSESVTKKMSVQGSVPIMMKYQITKQPSAISVTNRDLSKGYTDSINAVNLSVTTNNQNGYIIVVSLKNLPFITSASVKVDNQSVNIPINNSAEILMPFGGSATMTTKLSFRFHLSPDASVGQSEWPVAIMVNPI